MGVSSMIKAVCFSSCRQLFLFYTHADGRVFVVHLYCMYTHMYGNILVCTSIAC